MLAGCSDGGSESPEKPNPTPTPTPDETASITIDSNIVTNGVAFEAKGGEKSVSFSSNKDWTLSIATPVNGTAWCTVSATSGAKGDATVKFTVKENAEYDDRSVSVTIIAGTASKTFTITQKCAEALLVTSTKFEVSQEGGTIEVEVKANINYELQIAETAKGWISETKSRALTTKKHAFTVAANEEYEKREGEIYIKSGDKVETVKVYQAGGAILVLSKNEVNVSDKGETISVDIKSNIEYGIQMPDVDWINNVDNSRAASSHTLKYVVAPNESYDSRTAEIIFYDKNSSLKDTLKVVQAQKDAIILSQKGVTVKSEGETIEVKLSANVDFEVTMPDVDWITQVSSRALTEHTLYFKVAENTSEKSRNTKIVFTNKSSGISDKVEIIQPSKIVVVTLKDVGWLSTILGEQKYKISSLKIIGPLNQDDARVLDNMVNEELKYLDLSEASMLVAGSWRYFNWFIKKYPQKYAELEDNSIPPFLFSYYNYTGTDRDHGCYLKDIILPSNLEFIGAGAFSKSYIKSMIIPEKVKEIDEYAFYSANIAELDLSKNESIRIGDYAFYCSKLEDIKGADAISYIGDYAFYDCNIKSLNIPRAKRIGSNALLSSSLTDLILGDSLEFIGKEAFGYSKLTNVTFGNSEITIESEAFNGCANVINVYLKDIVAWCNSDINSLPKWELYINGNRITELTIPKNVKKVDNIYNCQSIEKVTISDGIKTIESGAFKSCNNLKVVSLGKDVNEIESWAFPLLSTVYCYATTPPKIISSKYGNASFVQSTGTLYVPKGCIEAYKASDWNDCFYEILEMEE